MSEQEQLLEKGKRKRCDNKSPLGLSRVNSKFNDNIGDKVTEIIKLEFPNQIEDEQVSNFLAEANLPEVAEIKLEEAKAKKKYSKISHNNLFYKTISENPNEFLHPGSLAKQESLRISNNGSIEFNPMLTPVVHNVVSTINLCCRLNLKEITFKLRNAEYNPKRFPAVILRIMEPRSVALVFESGKMICTGTSNEAESRVASRQFAKIIQKLGYGVKFSDYLIHNMIATCDAKFPIRLEGLASNENKAYSTYEPELFPGLIYRMLEPKIVLMIFVSGKFVITGGRNRESIQAACDNIYPILLKYRKKHQNNLVNTNITSQGAD